MDSLIVWSIFPQFILMICIQIYLHMLEQLDPILHDPHI